VNPLARVREWYDEAVAAGLPEADAMALATATPDGRPSVRFVLLKGIDDDGIRFFTNYGSRKAREMDANPHAAVTLYWLPVGRSVRMEGAVERLPPEESDAYFASRSRGARLGAWASAQGTALRDRAELDERVRVVAERFPDDIPRPDHWGGYKLRPDAVELWQGRPNRLHDREHFLRAPDGVWRSERLSP
jgi:pyridoxamine 5'-phosphate oxidase